MSTYETEGTSGRVIVLFQGRNLNPQTRITFSSPPSLSPTFIGPWSYGRIPY